MFKAYIGRTTCRGTGYHNHSYPEDASHIDRGVSIHFAPEPVRVQRTDDGRLIRRFAIINYWPQTGQMLVTMYEGATSLELESAIATATNPRQDPRTWDAHPCIPESRRVSAWRYVDEDYAQEVAEEMFEHLTVEMETADAGRTEHKGGVSA